MRVQAMVAYRDRHTADDVRHEEERKGRPGEFRQDKGYQHQQEQVIYCDECEGSPVFNFHDLYPGSL